MKLIHVLFLVLPLAAHADTWLSGGEAVIPPAVVVSPDNLGNHTATGTLDLAGNTISNVNRIQAADAGGDLAGAWTLNGSAIGGAAAGDNLGDHVATNTLDLGTNRLNVNVEGGMVPWQLGAVLDEGGIYPMPQFRGYRSGSPYAVGLLLAGASEGDALTYDSAHGYFRPAAPGGGSGGGTQFGGEWDAAVSIYTNGTLVTYLGGSYIMTNQFGYFTGYDPPSHLDLWHAIASPSYLPSPWDRNHDANRFSLTNAVRVDVGGGSDTNTVMVSGAGTADANGIYTRDPDGDVYNDGTAHPGWTNANGLTVIWVDTFFGTQHHLWNSAGAHAWYNTDADIEGTWSSYLGAPPYPTAAFGEAGSVAILPAGVVFPDQTMQTTAFVGNSATVTVSGVEFHFSRGAFVEAITP